MTVITMQNHSCRMRRLAASGLLPERAGQPVKAWAHISLARPDPARRRPRPAGPVDRAGPGAVGRAPRAGVRIRRGRRRVADGDAAAAIACDASMAPDRHR